MSNANTSMYTIAALSTQANPLQNHHNLFGLSFAEAGQCSAKSGVIDQGPFIRCPILVGNWCLFESIVHFTLGQPIAVAHQVMAKSIHLSKIVLKTDYFLVS